MKHIREKKCPSATFVIRNYTTLCHMQNTLVRSIYGQCHTQNTSPSSIFTMIYIYIYIYIYIENISKFYLGTAIHAENISHLYLWIVLYMQNVSTICLQQPAVQTLFIPPASDWKYLDSESSVSKQNNHKQSSTAGGYICLLIKNSKNK